MSNPRETREQDARAGASGLAQATASGGMIAVVAVILLASWILKADPRRGGASAARSTSASIGASTGSETTPWNMAPLSRIDGEKEPGSPIDATPPADGSTPADEIVTAEGRTPSPPDAPVASVPVPLPASPSTSTWEPPPSSIAARAIRDARRLAARRGAWVAQVAAVCNEESVAARLRSVGDSDRFYIVPVTIKDRSCYRMLWGPYDSAAAAAAADLPATLKSGEKLRAVAVKELVP